MSLGQKIRDFRTERGLTLNELASKIGISYSFLSAIERNLKKPSIGTIKKISETLNIPITYLFSDTPQKEVGKKLKLLREGRGLSIEDLAGITGLSTDLLRAFEDGGVRPTMDILETLADGLGVTVRYFLERGASNVSVGERLRKVRESNKITLVELAKRTGLSPSLISQIENDKVVPSLDTLEKLADSLGVGSCYFLLDQEDVKDLLSTLSPDVLEALNDPRTQAVLRAIRDFSTGEIKFILNQIQFFRKYRHLL